MRRNFMRRSCRNKRRFGKRWLLFTWVALCAAAYGQPVLARLQPPVENGQPVVVHVGLYSRNVGALDSTNDIFTESATLYMWWRDPRLALPPGERKVDRYYKPDMIWTPDYYIDNLVSDLEIPHEGLVVSPDGTVRMDENITANLSWNFSYKRFPFDTQSLAIAIRPTTGEVGTVVFVPDGSRTGIYTGPYTQLPLWNIEGISYHKSAGVVFSGTHKRKVQSIVFRIKARRRTSFYIWKLFVPLVLIVSASWCLFWLRHTDINNQIHVAFASLLSIIAFGFAVQDDVPLVAQLTLFDKLYFLCFALIIIQLIEVVAVNYLTNRDLGEVGIRLHTISRFTFPVLAAVIVAGIWYGGIG